jgi:hypothetical protein
VHSHLPWPATHLAILHVLLLVAATRIQRDFIDFPTVRTTHRRLYFSGAVAQREFLVEVIVQAHPQSDFIMSPRQPPRLAGPLLLTALLLFAQLWPAAPLHDPVSGAVPAALYLKIPWPYLILAPLFTVWDGVSMLSMSRLIGFLVGLGMAYLAWRTIRVRLRIYTHRGERIGRLLGRELAVLALSLVLFLAFLVAGALWHRPMLSLAGADRQDLIVDFHSHTNASHDVKETWMRGFDAEANRRWHSRAGFDAAFITDHNVLSHQPPVAGNRSRLGSPRSPSNSTVLCPGMELSAWRAHIVFLGIAVPIDRSRYKGVDGLLALLGTSDSVYGALSLASLPEYRRNHWERLDRLASAGLAGFEIVNASPKANELTRPEIDAVISVARAHNAFIAGVSDSHGWGATSMVWNLVRSAPGIPRDICSTILRQLRTGFGAVHIIERHRLRPDSAWPMWLTPVGVVWETWRAMGWILTLAWLLWIWGWFAARALRFALGDSNVSSLPQSSHTG